MSDGQCGLSLDRRRPLEEGAEYTYSICRPLTGYRKLRANPIPPTPDPMLPAVPPRSGAIMSPRGWAGALYNHAVGRLVPAWTYTYHNNVKFWLQNTSRSPDEISRWPSPGTTPTSCSPVAIGGAGADTVRRRSVRRGSEEADAPSARSDITLPSAARTTRQHPSARVIPVVLRFTNCDGTVNPNTDMRNGTLGVYLWVDHSFDDVPCPALDNARDRRAARPGTRLFLAERPGQLPGGLLRGGRRAARLIGTDINVSTGVGVNVYGRKVLDNSREVYSRRGRPGTSIS